MSQAKDIRERLESVGKKIAHPTRSDESAVIEMSTFAVPKRPLTRDIRGVSKESSSEATEEPFQTSARERFTPQQSFDESSSDTVATPGPSKKTSSFSPSISKGSSKMRRKSEKSDRTSAISQELRGSSSSSNEIDGTYSVTEGMVRVDMADTVVYHLGTRKKAQVEVVQKPTRTEVQVNVIRTMSGTNLEASSSEKEPFGTTFVTMRKARLERRDLDKIETDPEHERITTEALKPGMITVRPRDYKKSMLCRRERRIPHIFVDLCEFLSCNKRFAKCYCRIFTLLLVSTFIMVFCAFGLFIYIIKRSTSENIVQNGTMFPMTPGRGRPF